jgi:hypothetical protein
MIYVVLLFCCFVVMLCVSDEGGSTHTPFVIVIV